MNPETILTVPRADEKQPFTTADWNRFFSNWMNGFQAVKASLPNSAGAVMVGINPAATSTVTLHGVATFQASGVTISGTLTTTGNTVIGDAAGDTLTVNATSTFIAPALFNGAVTLGDAAGDAITVNGASTFTATVTINATLSTTGNTSIGDAAGDALTVNATSTFTTAATFQGTLTADSNVTLGNAVGDAIVINGTTTINQAVTITAGGINVTGAIIGSTTIRGGNGTVSAPTFGFSSDTNNGMYLFGADQVGISANSTAALVVTQTVLYGPDGTASSPGWSFLADGSVGMRRVGTNAGALVSNSNDRIRWDNTGVAFNGTAPVGLQTLGGASSDLATVITLANAIRTALRNYNLCN